MMPADVSLAVIEERERGEVSNSLDRFVKLLSAQ